VLQKLYLAQRESFNDSYAKFQQNMFTVTVDGRETAIDAVPLNSGSVLGILVDSDSTIADFDRKADVSQWNISTMMTWLTFERALIEFGDLILVILGAALTLGMKLAMPFMLAALWTNHRQQDHVSLLLWLDRPDSCLAFSVEDHSHRGLPLGNVAMAVGDSSPLYTWNYQTMRAITDPLAQPQYTVALAASVWVWARSVSTARRSSRCISCPDESTSQ